MGRRLLGSVVALGCLAAASLAAVPTIPGLAATPAPGFSANVKADAGLGTAGAGDNEPQVTVDETGDAYVAWQTSLTTPAYVARTLDGTHFDTPKTPDPLKTDADVMMATTTLPLGPDAATFTPGQSAVFWGDIGVTACGPLGIRVATSKDQGGSWAPADASCEPSQVDRPWLAAYTEPQYRGTANAVAHTWLYTEHHDFAASNIYVTRSPDGGATWQNTTSPANLAEQPGSPQQLTSIGNSIPSGIAVAQRGAHAGRVYAIWETSDNIYNAFGGNLTQAEPFDHVFLSYSDDNGSTWTSRSVYNDPCAPNPPNPPAPLSVNPLAIPPVVTTCQDSSELFNALAVDDAGNVYVAYIRRNNVTGGEYDVHVAVSTDGGDHWNGSTNVNTPGPDHVANPPGDGTHYEPWLAAGADGMVDLVYYRTSEVTGASVDFNKPQATSNKATWDVYLAQSFDHGQTWTRGKVSDHIVYFGDICSTGIFCGQAPPGSNWANDRTLYDVFGVAIGPDGAARVAWTDARDEMTGACQPGASPACEGGSGGGATRVYFACQTSGLGLHGETINGCPHGIATAVEPSPVVQTPNTSSPRPAPGALLAVLGAVALAVAAYPVRRRRSLGA